MNRFLILLPFILISCQSAKKTDNANQPTSAEAPKLTKPIVRKVWVPPAIEDGGRTYREGHFIYVLDKESIWSR